MQFPPYSRQRLLLLMPLLFALISCSFNDPIPSKPSLAAQAKHRANTDPATAQQPSATPPAVHLEVIKSNRTLRLWQGETLLLSTGVALGQQPQGHKTCQGDSRTPEGVYTVTERKADSQFYLALRLSYPNAEDRAKAAALGCDPGGDIMIHGLPNGRGHIGSAHRLDDWTEGCVAVTNEEMDRLWARVSVGTRVEIRP